MSNMQENQQRVRVSIGENHLEGNLGIPPDPHGVVLFAHGSGSSRHSPRNRYVAGILRRSGLATLLIDLLTEEEEEIDLRTRRLRFDVELLAERLELAIDWLGGNPLTGRLRIGCFGASTGAAATMIAAARHPDSVAAVVSRGGRPDLAGSWLGAVRAPSLLIVGGDDTAVVQLNHQAFDQLTSAYERHLEIIPGASHLFEEPGALEDVARLAAAWFARYLSPVSARH